MLAQKNEQINLRNEKLERTNNDLQQFAYIASHDLKEPIRMIGGYITLIERRYLSKMSGEVKEFTGYINEAVNRMYKLLDDLLSYSQLSIEEVKRELVPTEEVVTSVLNPYRQTIQQQNIAIYIDELPVIKGQHSQILQLFQNLICNAIKFQHHNVSSIITIECKEVANEYIFSVKDNRIGIEQKYLHKIFVAFQRLHTRDKYEGNGIGLSTCQKIVEQHGGKIWVQSEIGKGSTFFFSIPKKLRQLHFEQLLQHNKQDDSSPQAATMI